MRIRSMILGGVVLSLPLVFLSRLHAQNSPADPLKLEVIAEKDLPLALPLEKDADPLPPEKIPAAAKKAAAAPAPVAPANPPVSSAAPAVVSAPAGDCGASCCHGCLHGFFHRLFHPCTWCHHPIRDLFHKLHCCHSCGCGGGYPVMANTMQPPVSGTVMMGPGYAPFNYNYAYGYAYYPNYNVNVPTYPVAYQPLAAPARATPITEETLEAWKALPTNTLYGKALDAYWDKDHRAALEMFWILVSNEPGDSRFWYYKALTERAMGDATAARGSAQRGAALEYLDPEQAKMVNNVLERVQGLDRQFLREPGAEIANVSAAKLIVSRPVPKRNTLLADRVVQTGK